MPVTIATWKMLPPQAATATSKSVAVASELEFVCREKKIRSPAAMELNISIGNWNLTMLFKLKLLKEGRNVNAASVYNKIVSSLT